MALQVSVQNSIHYQEGGAMLRILFIASAAIWSFSAHAQDPVQTDGDKYKMIFENDCVRVLDYKDLPGDQTTQHQHPAFVLYTLSDFKRAIILPDGKVLQRQFKAGDVMWSDKQTHIGKNNGETPTHVILVEMKSQIGACAAR
ncbi:MAG: hypothetical protein Q7U12_17545 [Undibacterium sp.]|nr:hypothetical protein [Undibacterium sp.]